MLGVLFIKNMSLEDDDSAVGGRKRQRCGSEEMDDTGGDADIDAGVDAGIGADAVVRIKNEENEEAG